MHAKKVGEVTGVGFGMPCLLNCCCCPCLNTGKIREKYGIAGGFGGDCLSWVCCGVCTMIRDMNEIDVRN